MSVVLWTAEALARLEDIEAYIALQEGRPEIAKETVARIIQRTAQLATAPQSGHVLPDYGDPPVRELLARPYRIIYSFQIEEARCVILTVLHYRQLLPSKQRLLRSPRGHSI